ncbi:MAG: DUF4159 domain-containing protein [Armatimonadetes bacterium]|nr:DUF4159 domain-containing protein [Armatimonadota bacterium]NIM24065.1 DUF4159 domain-containing protein [Armatimonadota bacterium]NIM76441.1 DUF4159 domain-containing protein [Armatimonadota bacterium]NIN06149.1 DUF4159 domain-containing protein [Armatimonadota bacterium]NIO74684.1 DUF4159 domain-containing protein [Armatimonadota bacterium]
MMDKRYGVGGLMLVVLFALVAAAMLWPSPRESAAAAPEMDTPGSLNVIVKPGQKLLTCPLEHTDVEGWVTGDIARVRVTQRFSNPYEHPIEAVYVFPLPENSAVNEMIMRIGKRTVRGLIKEREEARTIYEAAKLAGKTASLLEQERPNIFTQSVTNIMPGDPIEISIWYVQDLRYDRGRYEFTFPMVVGPRYIPGQALPGPDRGGGWSPDTTRVPDASRITPPVLTPEERTGHDISLTLHLDAGVPARDVRSKSHDVRIDSPRKGPMTVSLAAHDTLPNKDFSLSWQVAGKRPEIGLLTHWGGESGYFSLIIQPKANFSAGEITPKEMVFCLDTSGSMSGLPIEKSKEVVKLCLEEMGPKDTFQVIRFAGSAATFSPTPVPATQDNIDKASDFIDKMRGGGGTEMLKGIEASLAFPQDKNRMRIVAFLTDGYIGNEKEILARIEDKLGAARIFSFGIGSSTNRYLLVKMAQLGRGVSQFVRQDENPDAAVRSFVDRISRPYLTDIEIEWSGVEVKDIYPSYVPDLFADQPVILHGRYEKPGKGEITIRGKVAGQPWQTKKEVILPAQQPDNQALATLWARTCIEDMLDQMYRGEDAEIVAEVTRLALAYQLMSPYTSFVAVEEKVVNQDGELVTVQVPVPMPEGVDYEGVFGPYGKGEMAKSMGGSARAGVGRPRTLRQPLLEREEVHADYAHRGAPLADAWMALISTDEDGSIAHGLSNLRSLAHTVIGLPAGRLAFGNQESLESVEEAEVLRVLIITGSKPLVLTDKARAALGKYLRGGGFIIIDSGGDEFYRSAVKTLQNLLPEARFTRLSKGHAVFQGGSMPFKLTQGCPVVKQFETTGPAQGFLLNGRLAVFISRGNLTQAWAQPISDSNKEAHHMGVNLIAHALQQQAQESVQ